MAIPSGSGPAQVAPDRGVRRDGAGGFRDEMIITPELLANSLLAGLLLGGFYAALSAGATIAFGLLEIGNIAHPTFAVMGAYAGDGRILDL